MPLCRHCYVALIHPRFIEFGPSLPHYATFSISVQMAMLLLLSAFLVSLCFHVFLFIDNHVN